MKARDLLAPYGKDKDMAMQAVLNLFLESPAGTIILKDEIGRQRLSVFNPRRNERQFFTAESQTRAARRLSEDGINILSKDTLGAKRSTRYWLSTDTPQGLKTPISHVCYEDMGNRRVRAIYSLEEQISALETLPKAYLL